MTEKEFATRAALLKEIQEPETYTKIILELRSGNRLHDFVEWVLKRKIKDGARCRRDACDPSEELESLA